MSRNRLQSFFLSLISLFSLGLLISSSVSMTGCSGREVDEKDPKSVYDDALDDVNDKRYTFALEKLKNIKNKFPYSNYATLASLEIADVHFKEENFIEAAAAYETFRDLHPKHERADFVLFRIGESYYNQLPDTEDRDLTGATKAIVAFDELRAVYTKSQYLPKAAELKADCVERLAKKEKYIADFYYKQDVFDSAARRYERIISQFAGVSIEELVFNQWAQSLIKQEKKDEAKHVWNIYVSKYPNGKYASKAGDWIQEQ